MMNADQDEILDRIRELLTSDETHDTCRAELAVVTTLHSDTLREWEALRVENEAMRARLASVAAERASIRAQLAALRDQIERGGCVFTRLGETAYLCDATKACGLCRLRNARDAWENQSKREEMRADIAQLSPPLTWSSVTPSEPGWYWCRYEGTSLVVVTLHTMTSSVPHNCKWAGPLTPPEVAK